MFCSENNKLYNNGERVGSANNKQIKFTHSKKGKEWMGKSHECLWQKAQVLVKAGVRLNEFNDCEIKRIVEKWIWTWTWRFRSTKSCERTHQFRDTNRRFDECHQATLRTSNSPYISSYQFLLLNADEHFETPIDPSNGDCEILF